MAISPDDLTALARRLHTSVRRLRALVLHEAAIMVEQGANAKLVMLIVEDEALIRWPLKQRLEEEGFSVVEAADGASALDQLSHDGIQGVLLDLRLPDIDGMEILRKLRQAHPNCRVWIMTAYGTPEVRAEALQLGVEEFIDKPFDVEALVQRLISRLSE